MSFGRLGALGRGFGRLGGGGATRERVIPGVITAHVGRFNITGMDAGLVATHLPLTAAVGTFTITGIDAALTYSGGGSQSDPVPIIF